MMALALALFCKHALEQEELYNAFALGGGALVIVGVAKIMTEIR